MWQDQFNLHEKELNPMDMHSLLQCLEAIEHICTQERSNAQSTKKASTKNKKGNKRPGMESTYNIPKKACSEKHYNLCKKHGGTDMSPEVHCNLCNHCYTLGIMPDPRSDIRCM